MLCRGLQEINKSIISKTTRHCIFFAEKKKKNQTARLGIYYVLSLFCVRGFQPGLI